MNFEGQKELSLPKKPVSVRIENCLLSEDGSRYSIRAKSVLGDVSVNQSSVIDESIQDLDMDRIEMQSKR